MEHMMPIVRSEQANLYADPSAFCGSPYSSAQSFKASEQVSAAVQTTIKDQLSAVRLHKYVHARNLATPDYCTLDPNCFAAMMAQDYPELIKTTKRQFSDTELNAMGTMAVQEVTVGNENQYSTFTYLMVRRNRTWRVDNLQRGAWMPSLMESDCIDQSTGQEIYPTTNTYNPT
jgi:hypothetical protein